MIALSELFRRIRYLFQRSRVDRDLEEEMRLHVEMRERALARAGIHAEQAHEMAQRRFGNATLLKEVSKDMWGWSSLERLAQDIRFGLRVLTSNPLFAAVAIATLALGIGANTAVFSLVHAVVLQPLPYKDPAQLVILWGNVDRGTIERRGTSYPDYLDWKAQSRSYVDMAAFDDGTLTLSGVHEAERLALEFVSSPYFRILGINPALGRAFASEEDAVPGRRVAILSDSLWRDRFGADPNVLGRELRLDSRNYTVVGVMPRGFSGITDSAQLWIPFTTARSPSDFANRGTRSFRVLARLKSESSVEEAQAEMSTVARRLQIAYPQTNEKRGIEVVRLNQELLGDIQETVLILLCCVSFVLLIACANVTNLLLARSEARHREIAVRTALGAGRGRLIRQLITESCLLTFTGAALGLLLAQFGIKALLAISPLELPGFARPKLDLSVLLFTSAVSLVTGVSLGLAPAAHSGIARLHDSLRGAGRIAGNKAAQRVRTGLIVGEIAVAIVLLIGAGLMARTIQNLLRLDLGFDPDRLLTLTVALPGLREAPAAGDAPDPAAAVSASRLLDNVRALPGVTATALGTDIPLRGGSSAIFYTAEGQSPVTAQNQPRAYIHAVTPEFFPTLRIPMRAGRTFTETEMQAGSPVVIVSESLTKRFWPNEDPIGKRIKRGGQTAQTPWLTIVGVVADLKYRGIPQNPTRDPDLFSPLNQRQRQLSLILRTDGDAASLARPIRSAMRQLDAGIPVFDVLTMKERLSRQTARSRFAGWLMGIFSALALLLAAIGVYGVMSCSVTERTREICVRMALGADRRHVWRWILRHGMLIVSLGLLLGSGAALALARSIRSLLFGVSAYDPATFLGITLLVAAVASIACAVPAIRATRVDPITALRHD